MLNSLEQLRRERIREASEYNRLYGGQRKEQEIAAKKQGEGVFKMHNERTLTQLEIEERQFRLKKVQQVKTLQDQYERAIEGKTKNRVLTEQKQKEYVQESLKLHQKQDLSRLRDLSRIYNLKDVVKNPYFSQQMRNPQAPRSSQMSSNKTESVDMQATEETVLKTKPARFSYHASNADSDCQPRRVASRSSAIDGLQKLNASTILTRNRVDSEASQTLVKPSSPTQLLSSQNSKSLGQRDRLRDHYKVLLNDQINERRRSRMTHETIERQRDKMVLEAQQRQYEQTMERARQQHEQYREKWRHGLQEQLKMRRDKQSSLG